ncbi:MAG: penicillin-binding protein 2 [Candidatus Latescibacterota bacterium]|nr:MAG: penicillin-binding protein 2 [Candidatus Latescibacterota bacterium]
MAKRDPRDERRGKNRVQKLVVLTVLLIFVLVGRLFYLQHIKYDYYSQYAQENQLQRERIIAPRGLIRDRHGTPLVDNVPSFDIMLPWRHRNAIRDLVQDLCAYMPLDSARVFERFEAWSRRNAGAPFPLIPAANKFVISFVRENVDLFPQLRVETRATRRYRNGVYAAHLLGYVGEVSDQFLFENQNKGYHPGDLVGRTGIENVCEEFLKGSDGQRVVAVNASGTVLGELPLLSIPPQPGKEVTLTIDAKAQGVLEELIDPWGAGAAVVMDVNDGAIIAAVSLPQFDPNSFAKGIPQAEWDRLYKAPEKPLFNRFLRATYPPGSTFKVISTFAALHNRLVNPREAIVYCIAAHRFGNRIFKCWKAGGHGYMNLHNGFVQSCDSYYYEVAQVMNVDDLADAAREFGLGEKTGVDLQNEAKGLVPDRKYYNKRFGRNKWTQGLVLNNIIGQGEVLATVLQMCRVAAVVANGGYLVQPHVIMAVEGEDARVVARKKVRSLSQSAVDNLRRVMKGVVHDQDGTARSSRIAGLAAAGKTGTAQNPHGEDHSWFIGYAPADDPEIAIALVVENAGHGGAVAAPITKQFYLNYFGLLPPDSVVTQQTADTPGFGGGDSEGEE